MSDYKVPESARVGHVHLKVSDIDLALSFYQKLLGFKITQRYGKDAVFLAAGNYHHHIGLNTWYSKGETAAPQRAPGLFHSAFLYPERRDLAVILKRLMDANYPITGAADHGVSEAIYLNDPDGNGVELYWDKPMEVWPFDTAGNLQMGSEHLNLNELLSLV
ncbi:MAG: VOC family protein [Daejeonella sp.]